MQKLLALVVVVFAMSLAPSQRADAQMRKCASTTLTKQDLRRLLKAASAVLPDNTPLQAPSVCRNPGSASSWMETEHRLNAEGAQEWWTVSCVRERRNWSCEPPHPLRSGTMSLVIDGRERTVTISLDGGISLADARKFTALAWSIYQDPASNLESCGPPEWRAKQKSWSEKRAENPLDPNATEIHGAAETLKDGTDVTLFSSGLSIRFPRDSNDPAAAPVCWSEWVIVT